MAAAFKLNPEACTGANHVSVNKSNELEIKSQNCYNTHNSNSNSCYNTTNRQLIISTTVVTSLKDVLHAPCI